MRKNKILLTGLLLGTFAISGCGKNKPDPEELLKTALSQNIQSADCDMQVGLSLDIQNDEEAISCNVNLNANIQTDEKASYFDGDVKLDVKYDQSNMSYNQDVELCIVKKENQNILYSYDSDSDKWNRDYLDESDINAIDEININDCLDLFKNVSYEESSNDNVYTISSTLNMYDVMSTTDIDNDDFEEYFKEYKDDLENMMFDVTFDIDKKSEQLKSVDLELNPNSIKDLNKLLDINDETDVDMNLYIIINYNKINDANITLPEEILNYTEEEEEYL